MYVLELLLFERGFERLCLFHFPVHEKDIFEPLFVQPVDVPHVWVFVLPSLVPLLHRRFWASVVALVPLAALAAMGGYAWRSGAADGLWLAWWEMVAVGLALVLVWLLPRRKRRRR